MLLNFVFIRAVHKGRWMKQVKKNIYIYPFKKIAGEIGTGTSCYNIISHNTVIL